MTPAWASSQKVGLLYRIVLCCAWLVFKIFYRHKVYGLEHFIKGGGIIAANHTSYYDPPIVSLSWPQEVHFLARETLFKGRFFGPFITALNSHPVSGDASDIGTFKLICRLLKEGKKVILFPEGKRSFDGELDTLKPGIAMLISRTHAAIIPTYIHGAYEVWKRGQALPKPFGKTACVFGTPILWADFAHLEKKEAQQAITDRLRDAILSLRAWYLSGATGSPP